MRVNWKRFVPIAVILCLMLLTYCLGATEWLSFQNLRDQRHWLMAFVNQYPVWAPLAYIAIYASATALSIPGAVFLTLFGGFLFGQPWATLYAVVGATVGAVLIFLAAQTALGELLKQTAKGRLARMRQGFQDNATGYLLFLRLVPLFPFWLVNLAPAFFGVGLWTYTWTTFVGIIPGAFVFAQAGTGIGAILDSGTEFSIGAVFNTQMRIALIALGCFALLPTVLKKWRDK